MKTLILFLFVLLFIPNCKTERKYLNQGTIKIIFTFDNKSNKLDINKSMNCLSSRLEKYCGLKPSLLKVKGFFQFSVSGSIDSMTLKNLFLLKGTFGLWDTYDYTDIIQMLDKANSLIGRLNLVKRFTDNNDSLYSFDQKRYPLYNKLVPLLKTNGTLREGPHAGLALMQDTALIDSVLKLPSIKNLFYKDCPENSLYQNRCSAPLHIC